MNIEDLRKALENDVPVEYKMHCLKRMMERDISRKDIIDSIKNGEIIEDYPLSSDNTSENSFPSCLILSLRNKDMRPIHVVVGYNGKKIIIISAYYPDRERWYEDYKTRKEH